MNIMIKFSLTLLLLFVPNAYSYQMWKQCDPQWANDQLGFSSHTICSAGCLMTSVTMAVTSLPTWANPKGMNQWLKQHGGYIGADFVWASVQPLGLVFGGLSNNINPGIALHLLANHFVIINVMGGAHWVLVNGEENNILNVNDPGFNRDTYTLGDVVQYGWYSRTRLPIKLGSFISGLEELLGLRQKQKIISTAVQIHNHEEEANLPE